MVYYIVPYLIIVLITIFSLKVRGGGFRFLFFISLIPALIVVVFRGQVGTDTASYTNIIDDYISGYYWGDIEVFFLFFSKIGGILNLSSQLILNLFSLFIISILYLFFSKTKHYFLIFSFLVFPIFFYDMTMNGVRYGMAFALSCYFIAESDDKMFKWTKNKFIYILAFLNHKTSLMFFILNFAKNTNIKNIIIIMMICFFGYFFLQDYLFDKFDNYSEYSSPGIFSGLQPLLISFLVLCCNSFFYRNNIKRNFYLFVFQILFYFVTQVSYAGIRLQFLELFFILLLLVKDDCNIKEYKIYLFLIFLIGFLGFLLRLNNMYAEAGIGPSPFIPYHFIWEN